MSERMMLPPVFSPRPMAACLSLAALLLALPAHAAGAADAAPGNPGDIHIDAPLSGWRNSSLDKGSRDFMQDVHYPASDVNTREGQSRMALIAGSVRRTPKPKTAQAAPAGEKQKEAPHTLIVNGVAMPLKVNENGEFSRPYAFGRGSNNVEVRSADGKHRSVSQFYEADVNQLPAKIRVVLSWNTDQTDLDLHVLAPDGGHSYFGNRILKDGGALDVDVTSGYGPEIFESPVAKPGRYYVYLNYYGGEGMGVSGKPATITVANVTVITNENTVDEKKQTYVVPMRRAGDLTLVTSFLY
jgi:uncharacterized protein YfaP (DUF2135 family)